MCFMEDFAMKMSQAAEDYSVSSNDIQRKVAAEYGLLRSGKGSRWVRSFSGEVIGLQCCFLNTYFRCLKGKLNYVT